MPTATKKRAKKKTAKKARKQSGSRAAGRPRHEANKSLGRGLDGPRLAAPPDNGGFDHGLLEDNPADDVTVDTSDAMDEGEQIPLFEYEEADAKEIAKMARQYSRAMKARVKLLEEEKRFKVALSEKIKGSGAKPTKEGKYKVHAGDLTITITPQVVSESVRVAFDKDAKSKDTD
jgi:hypothetical protein